MRTLLSIQVLRAFAAIAVVVSHVHAELSNADPLGNALDVGSAGVDLFFVVSGFVMVYASEPLFGRAGGPSVFFLRRLIRIVPLYWGVTTLYLVLELLLPRLDRAYSANLVVASYLFIPYPRIEGFVQPVVGQGWTLNYEVFFYGIFAVAMVGSRKTAVAVTSSVLVAAVVAGLWFETLPVVLRFWTTPIVIEFAFGMLLALVYRAGVILTRSPRFALIGAGLGLAGLAHACSVSDVDLWRPLTLGLPAAMIVAGATLGEPAEASLLGNLLGDVGDASYALYLCHVPPIQLVRRALVWDGIEPAAALGLFLGASIVVTMLVAIAVYRLIEAPVTRALRRHLRMAASPAAARG